MRVMVIIKANEQIEAGIMPSQQLMIDMGKFNEELVNAGIMTGGDGLKPSSAGKRVIFSGTNSTVVDGPFAETKELIAGYWTWNVKDMDEALAWAKRIPSADGWHSTVEIRPFYELEDFGEELTPAALEGNTVTA
jgi:hypothetical protein